MPDQAPVGPICINGHQQPGGASRFCIYCGAAMNVAAPTPPRQTPGIPPPAAIAPQARQPIGSQQASPQYQPHPCNTCGGHGQGLPDSKVVCAECGWLRPLVPGYQVDPAAFAWAADAKAMAVLQGMKPLNAAAKAVSEKVGRRWIEAAFNGVLLSEKQIPQIYGQAVRAARILGMTHMPDIYLSGDRAWDCLTFGSHRDSFIVVGSALAGNFQGVDMLFLLAREMGHCRSGHALWKTVIRFFLGEQGPSKGMLGGGIFNAILNPTHLVTGAIEMPLLAWARQAEITADRAGLLVVNSEDVARRVLLSWSLRSSVMFRQLNINDWIEKQSLEEEDQYVKLSELTSSSTPYLGPRMKLLSKYAASPEYRQYTAAIADSIRRGAPPKPPPQAKAEPNVLRFKCSTCDTPMRVPRKVLEGKTELPVKCPNPKCGVIIRLKKPANDARQRAVAAKRQLMEEDQSDA